MIDISPQLNVVLVVVKPMMIFVMVLNVQNLIDHDDWN
jgi:hypothetical protein